MPEGRLMSEKEWRSFGVKQSPGWEHYMIHSKTTIYTDPEPHILMFRREKDFQVNYN
jgi:cyclin-dependent kinase regulatory subunit CKS1